VTPATYRPSMLGFGAVAKAPKTLPRRPPGRPAAGRTKVLVSLEPAQLTALRQEAQRRSGAADGRRVDVSALVREALAAWIGRKR
jgi:hypothetical protein